MTIANGAASAAGETGAPSSATTTTTTTAAPSASTVATKPASAGKPRAKDLTKALAAKRAEKVTEEPASSDVAQAQSDATLGGDEAGKKPEGETADLQAGEGQKPEEKKDKDGELPGWVKERLGKEKTRREKLEGDLNAAKTETAKLQHLFEVQQTEIERLTELVRKSGQYDEKGEKLHELETITAAKERLAAIDAEGKAAFEKARLGEGAQQVAERWRAAAKAAVVEFPLVSEDEIKAKLRADPRLDIRAYAQKVHEDRMVLVRKQSQTAGSASSAAVGGPSGAPTATPTTVGKTTGTAKVQVPLGRKGMAQAFSAARARG
jgi:hypothetical protein